MFVQLLACFIASMVFVRNRAFFEQTGRGAFLGQRPYSAGIMVVMLFFTFLYHPGLPIWRLLENVVILVCLVRLAMIILHMASEKGALTVLIVVFVLVSYMHLVAFPVPLYRLLVVGIVLVGLGFCWRHARHLLRKRGPALHVWGLRGVAMMSVIIVVAEITGYHTTALYLLRSSIASIFCLLAVWILFVIFNSVLEMALVQTPLRHLKLISQNTDIIIHRLNPIIVVACGVLLLEFLLVTWNIYPSMMAALTGVLSVGFSLGETRISIGWVLTAVTVVYVTFLLSWMVQSLLLKEVLPKRRVTKGVQVSISKLVHYAILLVGFLVGLRVLGFDMTNMAILGGAVGVGVGFGLQAIINNFASGLILLFERPIKVGDSVQLGTDWGEVKNMGLRATVIQTYDSAEIVVPNSDLITNRVTNWTLTGRRVRLRVPVGVAYGSNVTRVVALMLQCATENARVLRTPAPQVLFLQFGDSSLNFELRAWVAEFDIHLEVKSELNMAIDKLFQQHGIEIPFPQRDLHLRSVDTPAVAALSALNPDEDKK
jgi:small-conductance mechanosensitive channel